MKESFRLCIQVVLITLLFGATLAFPLIFDENRPQNQTPRIPAALQSGDKDKCFMLLNTLYHPNKGLLDDYEKGTSYFYPGRTIRAFEATDPDAILKAFDPAQGGISYDDFERIWWATKWGGIKVDGHQEKFLDDLHHMVQDNGPFFWRDKDRVFHILETLRKVDRNWDMIKGRNESAVATKKALGLLASQIVERALADHAGKKFANNTWWDNVRRFFFPHYKKVIKILGDVNSFFKRADLAFWVDEPFEHALTGLAGNPRYAFTEADRSFFRGEMADTGAEIADIRKDAKTLTGIEPNIGDPVPAKDIRIADVYKNLINAEKAANKEFTAEFDDLYRVSNHDLDDLDERLYRAWTGDKSRKYNLYPMEDLNDSHLKIRHSHFAALSGAKRRRYFHFVQSESPRNSEYNVQIKWTVTVNHSKQATRWVTKDGKRVQETYTKRWTTSYTRNRTDTYHAYYDEVLKGRIDPDVADSPPLPYAQARGMHAKSASNGSPRIVWEDSARQNQILAAGAQARASEQPYRAIISEAEGVIDGILKKFDGEISTDPIQREKTIAKLEELIERLIQRGEEITDYQANDTARVTAQWSDDIPADFTRRNLDLMNRIDHMIFRLRHTQEQLRREHDNLGLTFILPEFLEAVEQLRKIHMKYRIIQWSTGGVVTAAGGYVTYDLWRDADDPYYDSKTKQFWNYLGDLPEKVHHSFQQDGESEEYESPYTAPRKVNVPYSSY